MILREVGPDLGSNRDEGTWRRNVSMQMANWGLSASRVLIDHDGKFTRGFDAVFDADGVKVQSVGRVAPNLNAYAKRWVRSLRTDCLDHLVICGEGHLRPVLKE